MIKIRAGLVLILLRAVRAARRDRPRSVLSHSLTGTASVSYSTGPTRRVVDPAGNPLHCFVLANVALRTGRNDQALRWGCSATFSPAFQRVGVEVAVDNVANSAIYDQCGLPQPGRTLRLQVRLR